MAQLQRLPVLFVLAGHREKDFGQQDYQRFKTLLTFQAHESLNKVALFSRQGKYGLLRVHNLKTKRIFLYANSNLHYKVL